ncbi:MAG: hypothetical protein IT331_17665 [Anaerolineae bacterium]|nr:hypothetical protein [Anaerolineae bacterium]
MSVFIPQGYPVLLSFSDVCGSYGVCTPVVGSSDDLPALGADDSSIHCKLASPPLFDEIVVNPFRVRDLVAGAKPSVPLGYTFFFLAVI